MVNAKSVQFIEIWSPKKFPSAKLSSHSFAYTSLAPKILFVDESAGKIEIGWKNVPEYVDGYEARAFSENVSNYKHCEASGSMNFCTIEDLHHSTTYNISVQAFKIIGYGGRRIYGAASFISASTGKYLIYK